MHIRMTLKSFSFTLNNYPHTLAAAPWCQKQPPSDPIFPFFSKVIKAQGGGGPAGRGPACLPRIKKEIIIILYII